MILILSESADEHVPLVTAQLDACNHQYLVLDPGDYPERFGAILRLGAGRQRHFSVELGGISFDLSDVAAVWNRRPTPPTPSTEIVAPVIREFVTLSSTHVLDGLWASMDCPWLPAKPPVDRAAHNKVTQLLAAQTVGFAVPETLITNEPSALVTFWSDIADHVMCKSLVNMPVESEGASIPAIYTRPVYRRDLRRLASARRSPTIFQQAIPKAFEVRATVVGSRVFAAEIHSQQYRATLHDWRHVDEHRVRYDVHELPTRISDMLVDLIQLLELSFGAVDLIVTPKGKYVFLEVNPNGQWGFIELLTGLPIAAAIAGVLAREDVTV